MGMGKGILGEEVWREDRVARPLGLRNVSILRTKNLLSREGGKEKRREARRRKRCCITATESTWPCQARLLACRCYYAVIYILMSIYIFCMFIVL